MAGQGEDEVGVHIDAVSAAGVVLSARDELLIGGSAGLEPAIAAYDSVRVHSADRTHGL